MFGFRENTLQIEEISISSLSEDVLELLTYRSNNTTSNDFHVLCVAQIYFLWQNFSFLSLHEHKAIVYKNNKLKSHNICDDTFSNCYLYDSQKYFKTNTKSLNTSLIVLFRLEIKQSGREQLI